MIEQLYTGVLQLIGRALPLASHGAGKLARGIRGRHGAVERIEAWAAENRVPSRPLVWFHAPSVGEGFQARAVMEALRASRPDVQIFYSFFSPSAEAFAATAPADLTDYLPLDLPTTMRRVFDALRPGAVAFSKTEIWPNITREAERRGIPTLLLSATLPPTSSRLRAPARLLLGPAHQRLHAVGAISDEDGKRFERLGVARQRIEVMGDARFDQVARRAAQVDTSSPLLRLLRDPARPTLVAGSTWQEDEVSLVPAIATLRRESAPLRALIVPHEPTPAHLEILEERLAAHRLQYMTLGRLEKEPEARGAEVVIVDRVGILGDLYALADIAYVGGGFGTAGLHSVLEPAAYGAPVLFGPHHENAREAAALVERGGAFEIADEIGLGARLKQLARDEATRTNAGEAARRFVVEGTGAADRGARLVLAAMDE